MDMADHPIITCPECDKKFKTKADVRGKRIKCPFCAELFLVPSADDEPNTAIERREGGPAAVGAAAEADENDNPYGVTELDLAPRCPNCAEEMESHDAVVCLHCGYNTLTR